MYRLLALTVFVVLNLENNIALGFGVPMVLVGLAVDAARGEGWLRPARWPIAVGFTLVFNLGVYLWAQNLPRCSHGGMCFCSWDQWFYPLLSALASAAGWGGVAARHVWDRAHASTVRAEDVADGSRCPGCALVMGRLTTRRASRRP